MTKEENTEYAIQEARKRLDKNPEAPTFTVFESHYRLLVEAVEHYKRLAESGAPLVMAALAWQEASDAQYRAYRAECDAQRECRLNSGATHGQCVGAHTEHRRAINEEHDRRTDLLEEAKKIAKGTK